jgi:hypothetical protein
MHNVMREFHTLSLRETVTAVLLLIFLKEQEDEDKCSVRILGMEHHPTRATINR